MKKSPELWLPIIASLVVTPICLLPAAASANAGHGSYIAAIIFSPYTMLSALIFDVISVPFIIFAVLQFPLYGAILGKAAERKRFERALSIILAAHALAASACFIPFNESFRR